MIILLTLIISISIITSIFAIIEILVLHKNYPYYKKTYKALVNLEYVFDHESSGLCYYRNKHVKAIGWNPYSPNDDDEIILFADGSIKLLGGDRYIHAGLFILEPYSMYWGYKIRKILKENKGVDEKVLIRNKKINEIIS